MHVRRVTERVDDLERAGLLALDPVRVDRVHDGHRSLVDRESRTIVERLVEVPADLQHLRAVDERLRELAERDVAFGDEHDARDARHAPRTPPPTRRCCRSTRRRPPCAPSSSRLRDRDGHPPVLEGAGRVRPFDLQEHPALDPLGEPRRLEEAGSRLRAA